MKLAADEVRAVAAARGLTLSEALRRAGVSRNAYYHLSRRADVLPRTLRRLAASLGVPVSAVLREAAPDPSRRAAALLREARVLCAADGRASFDNVWHTLALLDLSPAERLQRSLLRGRARTLHR